MRQRQWCSRPFLYCAANRQRRPKQTRPAVVRVQVAAERAEYRQVLHEEGMLHGAEEIEFVEHLIASE